MVAVERMLKRGSFEAGPESGCARGCGGCPLAASCRPQTVRGESGSGQVLVFKGGFEELLSLPKLPNVIDPNFIDFGSARQGSGESPITRTGESEKTCSECNKPASTCLHSETSKR